MNTRNTEIKYPGERRFFVGSPGRSYRELNISKHYSA